jgi:threonine/homoserine/homoserine lactone efflux protein
MNITYLFKGIIAGAFIALPVGPIGIFCLRRMLTQGALVGLASGFGSATADTLYAALALLGLSFVSSLVLSNFILFRIISSLFLCVLGTKIFLAKPPRPQATWTISLMQAYFSTLALTLTNPLLVVSFAALFTILDTNASIDSYYALSLLFLGVFIGSSSWWILLSGISSYMSISITPQRLANINKVSGFIIVLFGLITLISIVLK